MRKALWMPAVAILLAPLAAHSQAGSAWNWGLIGGVNLSTITGGDEGSDTKMGFVGGLTAQMRINSQWSFNAEGHYSMKGAKSSDGGSTATFSLDYLEVPLLFRGMTSSGEMRPFVEFGAAPAYKLRCKAEAEGGGVSISGDCDDDQNFEINGFDLGLVGGAGIEFTAMGRPWTLGGRYTWGMMKLNDDSDGKNANIQVLLGFRFR
jgi:hypothetical protein